MAVFVKPDVPKDVSSVPVSLYRAREKVKFAPKTAEPPARMRPELSSAIEEMIFLEPTELAEKPLLPKVRSRLPGAAKAGDEVREMRKVERIEKRASRANLVINSGFVVL